MNLFKKNKDKAEAAQIIEDAEEYASEMIEQAKEEAKKIWKKAHTDAETRIGKALEHMKGEPHEETVYFYRSKWYGDKGWGHHIFSSNWDNMNGYPIAVKKVKFIEGEGLDDI